MQVIKLTPYETSLIGQYLPGFEVIVFLDTTASDFTTVLPDAQSTVGTKFTIANISSNIATVTPIRGQFINDLTSITLRQWDSYQLASYGKGYYVVSKKVTEWEDLNFAVIRSGGVAATRPDDVIVDSCYYREFTSANNQSCGDAQEIPHNAKLNRQFYGHLHGFLKAGESAGTTGVTFTIHWKLHQSAGVTSGSFALSKTSAEITANPNKVDFYNGIFNGSTELGAQLSMSIYRTDGNAGKFIVNTYGIHYEIDSVGSSLITTK